MAIQFTRNGRKALLWAQVEAMRRGELYVEQEHLLLGLLHGEETGALRLLERLSVDVDLVRDAAQKQLGPEAGRMRRSNADLSVGAKKIVQQARRETEATGDDYVGTAHLLLAILRGSESPIDGDQADGAAEDDAAKSASPFTTFRVIGLTYDTAVSALRDGGAGPDAEETTLARYETTPAPTRHEPPALSENRAEAAARLAQPGFLRGRSLLSVNDLADSEIAALFELTRAIKAGRQYPVAQGKTLALVFEKPSLRTKVTFAVAMTRLGGQSLYLSREEIGMGTRESAPDVARGLSRWVDAIAARTFADQTVRDLAHFGTIPVINALTDIEHPCQAFADFYTVLERRSSTKGAKMVFVGDGNNVAHSLMLLAPRLGTHFTLACPPGYEPDESIVDQTQALAHRYGTRFEITHNALVAADDADVLYTDVWTSMGQESEKAKRLDEFRDFQINAKLLREAKEDAIVLHCLPAHRGEEITDAVIDGPHSAVFDEAENRLHVQQALLAAVL